VQDAERGLRRPPGDLAGYSHGHHITWTSKGPFVKKFWTITMDQTPAPLLRSKHYVTIYYKSRSSI
jgi:hypothetical protein